MKKNVPRTNKKSNSIEHQTLTNTDSKLTE